MKTITLIYFNAGGGHRAAATALATVIGQQQRPWRGLSRLSEAPLPEPDWPRRTSP